MKLALAVQTAMAGLTAELERLQKPSGSEALRARLQKLRASEARARSVLSSRELGSAGMLKTATNGYKLLAHFSWILHAAQKWSAENSLQ